MQIVTTAVLVLALLPLVYYLLALYCVIGHFHKARKCKQPVLPYFPPASILKPVRGLDHEAYENFASFCRLDYPHYEIVFAVSDGSDPVIPVIDKIRADFPARSVRLITNVPHLGTSDKVNNLCQLTKHASYDLLVMSDSDVRVEPDYLRHVTAPFADPQVGAVTAFYKRLGPGTFLSTLGALGMYMDSAPAALVAKKIEGGLTFAFGWTMATSKSHLAEIGGWEAIVNYHSDDFELGNRISRRGHRVELIDKPVSMVFPDETLAEHLRRELRWSIGLRSVRPLGYWGLAFTHGLPWALLAATVCFSSGSLPRAISYLVAYLVLRMGLTWTTGKWGIRDQRLLKTLYLVPLRDAVSFVIWLAGFFTDMIVWRGLRYHVRHGQLVAISSNSPVLPAHRESVSSVVG